MKIILEKLKNKIKEWLGITSLEYINISIVDDLRKIKDDTNNKLYHNEQLIKSFLATCETGYDLGVSKYHKNYCVFVRQGKGQDFVKFIDLSHMDINDIKHFEKSLEYENRSRSELYYKVDAPAGVKDYFIYKW